MRPDCLYRSLGVGLLLPAALAALTVTAARADIVNSLHNFSRKGWAQYQICLPCHTPHHAMDTSDLGTGLGAGKLWNHALPLESQTYILYGTGGEKVRNEALDPHSILCMGCHDGTVALDKYGKRMGQFYIGGSELIGTDLRDDHPVGATAVYESARPGYHDPSTWENQPSGFRRKPMMIEHEQKMVVSCTTCHEPHQRGGHRHMLWHDNAGSALCLKCHNK